MSRFEYDPADLDEEQLEALDGLTDDELATYLDDPPDTDPLAGYSHAPGRPFPEDAAERGIADLPDL